MRQKFLYPKRIIIKDNRWDVDITIQDIFGKFWTFIVSADSALTDSSGIWFGTREEYDEEIMET